VLSGVVVAIARNGKLAYLQAIGTYDRAGKVPLTPDAIFWIASMVPDRDGTEELAKLDELKMQFFANISHEFRTPLTLMPGPIEDALSVAEEPLGPGQRERIIILQWNGLRLQRLVNALLDFSRVEAGRIQAVYQPTDIAALTHDFASSFRPACEKAGLRLTIDTRVLPESVFVDHEMWEKIVLNLVSNAFPVSSRSKAASRSMSMPMQPRGATRQ
jgi:signal transduction histidine kinase